LGYVTARDRLFQIELQARAGGGTLTELVGEAALRVDRATHASGMPHAAAKRLVTFDTASVYWQLIHAYADGVKSYLEQLSPAEYPFEYKLLGRVPKRWQPIDLMHLLNRMGQTLATTSDEFTSLEASAVVGREAASALFPV